MKDHKVFVKYSEAGPRYTSYPAAVEFSTGFSYGEYLRYLKESERGPSLYFHLSFCRDTCHLYECNIIYMTREESKKHYPTCLLRKLETSGSLLDTQEKVVQVHFGSDTPTFFSTEGLENLVLKIKSISTNSDV